MAKLRWRIEHDYRELKDGLGLDHYEGRTWTGWHHHVTLVTAAHAFCTLQRLDQSAFSALPSWDAEALKTALEAVGPSAASSWARPRRWYGWL